MNAMNKIHPTNNVQCIVNRPVSITIQKKKNSIIELPFGWGEGEPPTPEDEEEKIETKKINSTTSSS